MDATTRRTARTLRRHGTFDDVTLPQLPSIPGQISKSECRFLYWLVASTYTGRGAVVELGSWLGLSSAHLAAGLRDSGIAGELHCFDRFTWDQKKSVDVGRVLRLGDDTTDVFLAHVKPVFEAVVAHRTEIESMRWDGGPVEILFLDAPKGRKPFVHVLSLFQPHLDPAFSYVASQDFGLPTAFAQALCVGRLSDVFELRHTAGYTAGFTLARPLPPEPELRARLDPKQWSAEDDLRTWDAMLERIDDPEFRTRLEPGICMHLIRRGEPRLALSRLRACRFDDAALALWRKFAAESDKAEKYQPLFSELGIAPAARTGWFRRLFPAVLLAEFAASEVFESTLAFGAQVLREA